MEKPKPSYAELENLVSRLQTEVADLKESLALALARKYGRSSELYTDVNDRQGWLFEEGYLEELNPDSEPDEQEQPVATVPEHTRKKNRGKRQPLPSYLPIEEIHYELPDEELVDSNGEVYTKIGEETTEQLEVIPAEVKVIKHIRFKYAVRGIEELGVKIAPMPTQPIPKSIASAGLLAHITQAKFCHHLPLYRQEQIWRSLDICLPRNSMCRWLRQLGEKVQPIIDELMEQIKLQTYVQADETTVTVINDHNKKAESPSHKGYMWLYVNKAGVVFDYQSGRAGRYVLDQLGEYKGFVQTDAYSGYNALFTTPDRTSVGCWAHARRKFHDIVKGSKKKKAPSHTQRILNEIGKLYQIERHLKSKNAPPNEVRALRQEKAIPVLHELKNIFEVLAPKTPPTGLMGKAIAYALNNWQALCRYTENGELEIDNNSAERAIKPFTVGRKNWLFSGNTRGAKASANLFS